MWPYVIGGLVLGGVYAISAVGLVVTYVSSKVLNFAHGAIAFFVAMTFYQLDSKWHWPTALSAAVAIGLVAPAIGVFLWVVLARFLAGAPRVVMVVATVGLYVALTPATYLVFGSQPIYQPPGLGGSNPRVYHLQGVAINANQAIVLIGTALVGLTLFVLLRYTTAGLLIRAVVDSPRLASLSGTDPQLVGGGAWALGTFLAGLAGVLLTPLLSLDAGSFTLLIVASFAAVVIARLRSIPLAFGGALLLGLAEELSVKWLPSTGILSHGVRPSIPFLLMTAFLLAYQGFGRTTGQLAGHRAETGHRVAPTGPVARAAGILVVAAGVAVVSLAVPGYWVGILGSGVALSIALLSYAVVTGQAGIISLCQISFAGVGAAASAQLATVYGVPVLLAILVAALIAVPIGLLVAVLAVRLGDLYVALLTLGFGLLMDNLVFAQDRFDKSGAGVPLARPALGPIHFTGDRSFLYLGLGLFLVLAVLVRNLRTSTTGMTLTAVRSSEAGVATLGLSVVRAKLVAFGVSAFIAGVGGGLMACYTLRSRPVTFDTLTGVIWLAVVVTLGVRSSVGPLLAGLAYVTFPQLIATWHLPNWALQLPPLLFGLGAIGLAREPEGVVAQAGERWARLGGLVVARVHPPPSPAAVAAPAGPPGGNP